MKKFKFTLQTVHNFRELRKERESVLLGELQAEADQAMERVRHYEALRNEAIDDYTSRLRSGEQMNAIEMELNSNHFDSLKRLRQEAEKIAEEKDQACQRQIEAVAAAMSEVKVTGRLRETQKSAHDSESARQEQNSVDEIVSTNFARQLIQIR
ncbi:MAG: hypothetical protein ACKVQJ_09145 [Pyrinomonadaceae bacterium]